jgi:hypothetical protein
VTGYVCSKQVQIDTVLWLITLMQSLGSGARFSAYCSLYLVLANSNFHVSKFSNSDKDA